MAVYIDDMEAKFRRMKMCHMIADSEHELHEMARRIGVARRWFQGDHYDVCLTMKAKALKLGAVAITWRQAGMMIKNRKMGHGLTTPETCEKIWRADKGMPACPPTTATPDQIGLKLD